MPAVKRREEEEARKHLCVYSALYLQYIVLAGFFANVSSAAVAAAEGDQGCFGLFVFSRIENIRPGQTQDCAGRWRARTRRTVPC